MNTQTRIRLMSVLAALVLPGAAHDQHPLASGVGGMSLAIAAGALLLRPATLTWPRPSGSGQLAGVGFDRRAARP